VKRASIDIGSNTILLLIATVTATELIEIVNETRVTSLGKELEKTGKFQAQPIEDSFQALSEYTKIVKNNGIRPQDVIVTATEASRVATNSAEFIKRVEKELSLKVRIINAEGEAYYTALGVVSNTKKLRDEFIIMDIGGASTEFIKVQRDPFVVLSSISLPFGSVRGTDWIKAGEFDQKMNLLLKDSDIENYCSDFLLCVAGSMTSLGGMIKGLKAFDSDEINGSEVTFNTFEDFTAGIENTTPARLLEKFPFLGKRSQSILAGAQIGLIIGKKLGIDSFEISTLGLRYGTIRSGSVDERFNYNF
jgi:exopolyphosphatase / guanosine-5'-triphosphate,3'-diphosphate pyrophosphatase